MEEEEEEEVEAEEEEEEEEDIEAMLTEEFEVRFIFDFLEIFQ